MQYQVTTGYTQTKNMNQRSTSKNISGIFSIILILLISFVFCSDVIAAKFGKISKEEWAQSAPEDYPEATAIVLLDEAYMNVMVDEIRTKRIVRIKILTTGGFDKVGERKIEYHKEYDKIKNFKAHTISPDGEKFKVKKDAIFTKTLGQWRNMTFSFPQLEPGCIIEYQYMVISKRFIYLSPWYFQSDIYTLKSEFKVKIAAGYKYDVTYKNIPRHLQKPKIEERPDMRFAGRLKIRTFIWTLTNLPPITDEPYMSAVTDYLSSLRFRITLFENLNVYYDYRKTWTELGKTAQDIIDEYNNKGSELKRIAGELTQNLTASRDKAKAIYDYVVTNYQSTKEYNHWYMADDKISKLLETKRGTPEEKNILLTLLFQEIGLSAFPVMISERSHGHVNTTNPNLRQFNYIISYVEFENTYLLLDAVYAKSLFGLLPPSNLVEYGLLIDGNESSLIKIGILNVDSYRGDITRMYVDSEGEVACTTKCVLTGYWASQYGQQYDKEDPEDFIMDRFTGPLPGECNLGDYSTELDSNMQLITLINFTGDELATSLDNNMIVKPVCFRFRTNPFKSEKRFFPVDFMYPFTYHNIAEIYFEDSVMSFQPPPDTTFEIPGASFTRQSYIGNNCWKVTFKLKVTKPLFKPQAYDGLREFFAQVALSCDEEFLAEMSD